MRQDKSMPCCRHMQTTLSLQHSAAGHTERQAASAHLEDLDAPVEVGRADVDDAVEAARARRARGPARPPVGGRHDDHRRALAEAVHLAQQLRGTEASQRSLIAS